MAGDTPSPSDSTEPSRFDPGFLLDKMGLGEECVDARFTPLTGGVSSEIWLVDSPSVQLVVKRPRRELDVEATWVVPRDRGQAEVDWLRCVGEFFPDNVPRVLAFDPETFATALSYFPSESHSNWKTSLVAGDDYLVTNSERIEEVRSGSVEAALIKVNQVGTVTEAHNAVLASRQRGLHIIVSARSGETEDVWVTHLATGWQAEMLKVGSITRGERTAKWNELLRIGEALGDPPLAKVVTKPHL